VPKFAHMPMILGSDKARLSKRHGATSVLAYKEMGYLPEALVNYLALLGWNPGGEEELFTLKELTKVFSIEHIQKGGAVFNTEKLDWFNAEYIKKLPEKVLVKNIETYTPNNLKEEKTYTKDRAVAIANVLRERIHYFSEVEKLAEEGELDYYLKAPLYEKTLLLPKDEKDTNKVGEHLAVVEQLVEEITADDFEAETIKSSLWDYATEKGRGVVLWPMRVALSGRERSLDPFTLAAIIGKEETLSRLLYAQNLLKNNE